MKLFALTLLLSPFPAFASFGPCELLAVTRQGVPEVKSVSSCGQPELQAALVKLWANHDETEVDIGPDNLEVTKLYQLP